MEKKRYDSEEIMRAGQEQFDAAAAQQVQADKYLADYKAKTYSYDADTDPIYQQAKSAYEKQAEKAAKNTQAQTARLTGGYGNSFGAVTAQQQYNAAMQDFQAAVAPQLEQNAYARFRDEQNGNLQMADYYTNRADVAYNRGYAERRDALNDAYAAEDYDWAREQRARQQAEWQQSDEDRAYDRAWTDVQRQRQQVEWTQSDEARALDMEWQELSRRRQQEQWSQADEDRAYELAMEAAKYGDYSKLNALGINTTDLEADAAADRAWTQDQRTQQRTQWDRQQEEWRQADEDRAYDREWTDVQRQRQQVEWTQSDEARALDMEWQELSRRRQQEQWSQADEDRAYELAEEAAKYGDISKLVSLGVDMTDYYSDMQADRAWTQAQREQQRTQWDRQQEEWRQADEDRAEDDWWTNVQRNRAQEEWQQTDEDRAYDRAWTDTQRQRQQVEWAQSDEAHALDMEWQELSRKRQQEQWSQSDEDRAYELAMEAAKYGDYSKLNALGINTADLEDDRAWTETQRARQQTEWKQEDADRQTENAWLKDQRDRARVEWRQEDQDRQIANSWTREQQAQQRTQWAQSNEAYALDKEWQQLQRSRAENEWSQADWDRSYEIAQMAAKYGDYSYLNYLGIDTKDLEAEETAERAWTQDQRAQQRTQWAQSNEAYALDKEWQQLQRSRAENEWSQADWDRSYEIAQMAAKYGDYSYLNYLGIDTKDLEAEEAAERAWTQDQRTQQRTAWAQNNEAYRYDIANAAAQYGDYSRLNALGVDTRSYQAKSAADDAWTMLQRQRQTQEWSQADEEYAYNVALTAAQYGDYGKLSNLGVDVSTAQKKETLDLAIQWAKYGDYSLLDSMGVNTAYLRRMQQADVLAQEYALGTTLSGTYGKTSGGTSVRAGTSGAGSLESVARDVIAGKYGNGNARKQALAAAGYDAAAVQAEVNRILSGGSETKSGSGTKSSTSSTKAQTTSTASTAKTNSVNQAALDRYIPASLTQAQKNKVSAKIAELEKNGYYISTVDANGTIKYFDKKFQEHQYKI